MRLADGLPIATNIAGAAFCAPRQGRHGVMLPLAASASTVRPTTIQAPFVPAYFVQPDAEARRVACGTVSRRGRSCGR